MFFRILIIVSFLAGSVAWAGAGADREFILTSEDLAEMHHRASEGDVGVPQRLVLRSGINVRCIVREKAREPDYECLVKYSSVFSTTIRRVDMRNVFQSSEREGSMGKFTIETFNGHGLLCKNHDFSKRKGFICFDIWGDTDRWYRD